MAKTIETRWAAECAIRFMKALRGKIESLVGDDEEVIRDTIEGATDVDPVMEALIRLRNEAEALCKARRALAQDYQSAARANEAQGEKIEGLILECLRACGRDEWKGVAGTTYIREGSWSTEIERPDLVPLRYQKAVPNVEMIKGELGALRLELEAMDYAALVDAAIAEGCADLKSYPTAATASQRAELIDKVLAIRIPGARLVKGGDTLTILMPRKQKAAA